MISKEDAKKLAELSRLQVSEDELESVVKEIGAILQYVGQIKEASLKSDDTTVFASNSLREDINPNETGKETEILVSSAPKRDGDLVKVKQVFS